MREFNSFGSFAGHLVKTAVIGEAVTHHLTEKSAEIVKDDAQERIGTDQVRTGPFNAWEPLAKSTEAEKARLGYPKDAPLLRTGELRDSIVTSVHGNHAVVASTDDIALYQELGTSRIPPRPFLGPAGFASKRKIGALAANTIIAWLSGKGWLRPTERVVNASGK